MRRRPPEPMIGVGPPFTEDEGAYEFMNTWNTLGNTLCNLGPEAREDATETAYALLERALQRRKIHAVEDH